ncbi:MFS general substrate transporter [Hyaloscypha variabilis F]|uniref:MFS general substrate transporter n=1 Tax=Hyaloscypha variabilis (strain UAMH 11265 / GT02V1 / F) TaxID=1149755 RepID=A0A2J6QZW8_HYAVF|nr:MFS general substrate transporter [Hyaloscypha variabilis F]
MFYHKSKPEHSAWASYGLLEEKDNTSELSQCEGKQEDTVHQDRLRASLQGLLTPTFVLLLVMLIFSNAVWMYHVLSSPRPLHMDNYYLQTPAGGYHPDKIERVYQFDDKYITGNLTVSNSYWRELFPIGNGTVALRKSMALSLGLPESQPNGNDTEHQLYLVAEFHQLHCLSQLRWVMNGYYYNDSFSVSESTWGHTTHCLEVLRQRLVCAADGTLMAKAEDTLVGLGELRTCNMADRNKYLGTLQKEQLLVLVSFTSVLPYLPELVESYHVQDTEVAIWTGLMLTCFSLGQGLTAIAWVGASNLLGRKQAIMLSLSCSLVALAMLSMSRSLLCGISARLLAGIASGSLGVIRTAVAETVPQKELQPIAFSIIPMVWTAGSVIGPMIGGMLVYPADRYPKVFGKLRFFCTFPFALPNMVVGIIPILGLAISAFRLRDSQDDQQRWRNFRSRTNSVLLTIFSKQGTNRSKRNSRFDEDENEPFFPPHSPIIELSDIDIKSNSHDSSQHPKYREVFSQQSILNLVIHTFLEMHSTIFQLLAPVFMHYPVEESRTTYTWGLLAFSGGFGIGSAEIGFTFTIAGIFQLVFQFAIFPLLTRRLGVLRCLKISSSILPLVYFVIPFTSILSSGTIQQGVMIILMACQTSCIAFAYPCSIIMLTNSVADLKSLQALNGVATIACALGGGLGPTLSGIIFVAGVNAGYIVIPWWILACIAIFAAIPVFWLLELEKVEEEVQES